MRRYYGQPPQGSFVLHRDDPSGSYGDETDEPTPEPCEEIDNDADLQRLRETLKRIGKEAA